MERTFAVINQMVADGVIENYAVAGAIGAMFYVEAEANREIKTLNNSDDRSEQNTDEQTIARNLRVASELRDLQERLAPLRAANKAERAKGKIQIRIKTK